MDIEELKKQLPEGVSLAELLPFLNKDQRAQKTYLEDGPIWEEMTKTCACGASFLGKQKFYLGYEGFWLDKELKWCPLCFKDHLEEYMLKVMNFELIEVNPKPKEVVE